MLCVGQDGEPDGIHLEKHLQSMRNQSSGGVVGKGGWKSQIEDLNEAVTEHVEIGAEALAEMGGGEQPLAWKPRGETYTRCRAGATAKARCARPWVLSCMVKYFAYSSS